MTKSRDYFNPGFFYFTGLQTNCKPVQDKRFNLEIKVGANTDCCCSNVIGLGRNPAHWLVFSR